MTRGHCIPQDGPCHRGSGRSRSSRAAGPVRAFMRPARTHHGLAPETAPVLQAQHAAARLVAHRALGTHGQVPFQPLVRHGDLRTTKTVRPQSPTHRQEALTQTCPGINSTGLLPNTRGGEAGLQGPPAGLRGELDHAEAPAGGGGWEATDTKAWEQKE